MEDGTREKLLEAGVNIDSAMERFMGNENLLIKFLKKFLDDQNYSMLKESMAEKRYKDAFTAAHTLKGLCGNLSLDGLFKIVAEEVEYLRNDSYAEAEELQPKVVEEYERVEKILKEL